MKNGHFAKIFEYSEVYIKKTTNRCEACFESLVKMYSIRISI